MTIRSGAGHVGSSNVPVVQDGAANATSAGLDTIDILDTIDVPIVVLGCDCTVSRFNRAATDALGLAPSAIGMLAWDIPALANVKDFEQLCAQVIADKAPCRCDFRNGDRYFLLRLAPYARSNGQIEGAVLTCTNVTAFRASIEQAVYEREYTKAILNTVIEPLVVLDSDLRVQTANRAFYSMFGVRREELQCVPLSTLGNDDWKTSGLWASLKVMLCDGSEFQPLEVKRDFVGIGRRTVLLDARRLSREGDASILLAFQDITERKRMEEELQRLNSDLEMRVRERTAELLSTIEEREQLHAQLLQAQKMESIGTLAGGIAHDFNNLLNIILGYTTLIQHEAQHDEVLEASNVIKETVERAAALVQQLLSVTRKTEIKLEEININAILEKLKTLVRETFPKTLDLALELAPGVPSLIADPNQVHQVLLNLCVNARDAMPDGGKLLLETSLIRGAELRERFDEAENDLYVRIGVADTGAGIDGATKTRIFEPFFTTKPKGQGTGLGLAVAYGIVTNHLGFIDVTSEPGQGTTFAIYLPVPECRSENIEQTQKINVTPQRAAGAGAMVLFVEDEEYQLRLMQTLLEDEGYRVLIARDGAEAVALHQRHKDEIGVVVLDFGLPKLNGWEAFQKMKQIDPNLNALFATGFMPTEAESMIRTALPAGIISKPYEPAQVLEKIAEASRKLAIQSEA